MPRVSVVISTYNRERYVGLAIESVLAQTFPDIELIVVDDGSTDSTREVVSRFGPRVHYAYQDNAERAAARNHGLRLASGDYVAFLDSDDVWLPDKIEQELRRFEQYPEAGVVFSDAMFMDESGAPLGPLVRRAYEGNVLRRIVRRNFVHIGAHLIRRRLLLDVNGFNETRALSGSEDWEAWVRLAAVRPFAHVRRATLKYRVHGGSTVSQPQHMERSMITARDLIFSNSDLHERIADLRPHAYSHVHLVLANLYRDAGDLHGMRRHLKAARAERPLVVLTGRYAGTFARAAAGPTAVRKARELKTWLTSALHGQGRDEPPSAAH